MQEIMPMISRNLIINSAKEVGFDLVGVVSSEALSQERERFNEWLARGYHSTLSYLERNGDKRFAPALLAEGTKSVIVCGVSYLSPYSRGYKEESTTKIASYALARDYHLTIKEMLRELAERLTIHHPDLCFRAFTDSAPLAEKSLAIKAGFGWIGRNSLVVNPHFGTMFNLGELLISEEVDGYDSPMQGYGCGTCRRCVDSCPNGAILDNRLINTNLCISCRTIERANESDTINLDGWIFGCDACQSVCPFNRHAPLHTNPKFDPLFDPTTLSSEAWLNMTDEEFLSMASTTPMPRAGLERIKANIVKNIASKSGNKSESTASE